MQDKKTGRALLEIFIMVIILISLTSIAIPRVDGVFDKGSEPVGYAAGVEYHERALFMEKIYGRSCGIIASGIKQLVPGCWYTGLLVPLLSIDYVQQLLAGQVSPEVLAE